MRNVICSVLKSGNLVGVYVGSGKATECAPGGGAKDAQGVKHWGGYARRVEEQQGGNKHAFLRWPLLTRESKGIKGAPVGDGESGATV